MFALSWTCKKTRQFLLGMKFMFKTDHALLEIYKKVDSIQNQQMLAMVRSTIEYYFSLEYCKGVRNVLVAESATR